MIRLCLKVLKNSLHICECSSGVRSVLVIMAKLVDSKSAQAILPNINFNDIPHSALGIESTRNVQINLKNTFLPQGPWEFIICQNSKALINLRRAYLKIRFTIVNEKGETPPDSEVYAPCQQFAASVVHSYHLKINDQSVYDSTVNHAYKTYIENTLMFSESAKKSHLASSGYYQGVYDSSIDPGFVSRRILTKSGAVTEMMTPISIDLFNQEKLFINYAKMELIAYPNKDAFLIDNYSWSAEKGTRLSIKVEEVSLQVQEYDLSPGLCMAIESKLINDRIHYPMTSVKMRNFFIEPNSYQSHNVMLFGNCAPKRAIVMLVSGDAYNGVYNKSAFKCCPYNLKNVYFTINSRVVPARPMNLNWTNGYMAAFVELNEALGFAHGNQSNGITPERFKDDHTFLAFDFSPTVHEPGLFDVIRQGNVTLKLEFGDKVPKNGLYCIVYAEFDSILSIDKDRTPYLDTSV